jgi:hypothetical protein
MFGNRCRGLLAGAAVVVALLAAVTPANATVSASYGTVTAAVPTVAACTGGTCMTGSATFTPNGKVATTVTVSVTLYRTYKAGATTASSSDYVVLTTSKTYTTNINNKTASTLALAKKCATVATVYYGYYTRVTMTNGTTTGTVSESSAIKQLKGCVTV